MSKPDMSNNYISLYKLMRYIPDYANTEAEVTSTKEEVAINIKVNQLK